MDTAKQGQFAINVAGAVLTGFLCALVMGVTYFAIRGYVPQESREFVTFIIGWGTSKLSTIIDWCFGTSSANKQQQDTIRSQADTIQKAQTALAPIVAAGGAQAVPDVTIPAGDTVTVKAADPPTP